MQTTMTRCEVTKQYGDIHVEFEYQCPKCYYPAEGSFIDNDIEEGDEISFTDTCPNCGEVLRITTGDYIHIEDYD